MSRGVGYNPYTLPYPLDLYPTPWTYTLTPAKPIPYPLIPYFSHQTYILPSGPVPYPPDLYPTYPFGHIHKCENITFPKLSLRVVINFKYLCKRTSHLYLAEKN